MYNLLGNYIAIFNEYPVENTHSILHSQKKGSDSADELSKKAKSIFQSKGKQSHYRSFFTTPKQFSFSHNQLWLLKVRCAQAQSSMFIKISQSPGQSLFSSNNNCNSSVPTHVTLPTMSPNKNKKMTVTFKVSLLYQAGSNKKCDLPLCNIYSHDENRTFCMVVFTHSMIFASMDRLHVHCVRSFYKKSKRGLTMHRSNVISVKMVHAQSMMTLVAQIALVHGTQQTSMRVIRVLATTSQLHYQHQILRPLFA